MKIDLYQPWRSVSGTYNTTDLVYYPREGELVARAKTRGAVRPSAERDRANALLAAAARRWRELPRGQREAWQAYAARYCHTDDAGRRRGVPGQAVYVAANCMRLALGLGARDDAPQEPPPIRPRAVERVAAADPDTLALRIVHDLREPAGHVVVVRVSPANRSAYRYVRGLGAASAAPLPPSGGVAEFTDVQAPARLRVEARIVRLADGMRSLANPDV